VDDNVAPSGVVLFASIEWVAEAAQGRHDLVGCFAPTLVRD
jgi:hypothetical protein